MPDIAMCKGKDCSLKDKCYRYMAEPDEYRQSYIEPDKVGTECELYWEVDNEARD